MTDSSIERAGINWAEIDSIPDAYSALQAQGIEILTPDELVGIIGDGFVLIEDKDKLLGRPMLILEWANYQGDHGPFVTVRAMTNDGERIIFNDGSTGIRSQLDKIAKHRGVTPDWKERVSGGIAINGLRVSEYDYTDPNTGKVSKARTYYLA